MSDAPAQVLAALRRAGAEPCSGALLSEQLGVSRAQIWKHVEALRGRGYRIDGAPGDGYRLVQAPDRLYPEEIGAGLETRWLARVIHYLEETDSTNRVAGDLAREGAAHGTTVIAEGQTAGRGRLGRRFYSPSGVNLYTSIVLRPAMSAAATPPLILTAAIAVAETISETVGARAPVEIKWPNDVLLGGKKTCGILMEMAAEATQVSHLVLGIGVNLNVDAADFPEEFRSRATSLASFLGRRIVRADFACRLYGTLEELLDAHWRDGFGALRERFESWFRMDGRRIRVRDLDATERVGVARGVDPDGALRFEREDGGIERVIAGDITS